MPEPISQAAQTAAGSAATAFEGAVWDALGLRDAVEGARLEAERSGLPGVNDGGPGDAYRHLLITGEMKRRFGSGFAELFADGHEFVNDLTSSQTELDGKMDNANNGVAAGAPEFETWEQLVAWARGEIVEAAAHNGDGQDGRAFWYSKQPADWRPDFTDVPITPIERGGVEHRYAPPAPPDGPMTEPMGMAEGSEPIEAPLDRPVASWTGEDVATVMNSPAYLQPHHPRRTEAERGVREWFERRFGIGPVPVDATGRAIRHARTAAGRAGACPVPVRAHSRDGGKVEVGAHCRSRPAA